LGVGTAKGSQLYAGSGFKTDNQGNTVVTRLDSRSLQTLANRTGGQYFEINETKNDVSRLINTISRIEGELRDTRFVDVSANRYHYFLLIALFLLVIDVLINVKTVKI
jgi:Ca-activated chloride channel family protein